MAEAAYIAMHLFFLTSFVHTAAKPPTALLEYLNCVVNLKKLLEILPKVVAVMSPGAGTSPIYTVHLSCCNDGCQPLKTK